VRLPLSGRCKYSRDKIDFIDPRTLVWQNNEWNQ
jgi:hypothetical protein